MKTLEDLLLEAEDALDNPRPAARRAAIPSNPIDYAERILHVSLTPDQQSISRAILEPPYKVMVDSAHSVGKTFLAAVLVNWWYDYYNPGIVLTTSPNETSVKDVLWGEIRLQRSRARFLGAPIPDDFAGSAAPVLQSAPNHWAKGLVASKGGSFQGRHTEHILIVFDEHDDIDPMYWVTSRSMVRPQAGNAWFVIGNPVSTTSQAYLEQSLTDSKGKPVWKVFQLSALTHPNVLDGLSGRPPSIPEAVTCEQVDSWVREYGCDPVAAGEVCTTDFQWRGVWYRPGPEAEARILGRRPSQGTYGVWSEVLWQSTLVPSNAYRVHPWRLPQIGCDVAYMGDDYTAIHIQWANVSLWHETHNGWSAVQTAARLRELALEWGLRWAEANVPRNLGPINDVGREYGHKIPIFVDDVHGGGVTSICQANGLNAIVTNAAEVSRQPFLYPNKRSELWFCVAELARGGLVSFAALPGHVLQRLRSQAMAPTWKPNGAGQRVVEEKLKTKEKIGRSPDDMDAVNLAYVPWDSEPIPRSVQGLARVRGPDKGKSAQERRGWLRVAGEVEQRGGSGGLSRGYGRYAGGN